MFYRKRYGRGFAYYDTRRNLVKDEKWKEWFRSLVIPPAWTEVEISSNKSADLLVTGRDAKGRKQYIYHPRFREKKAGEKFDRIVGFADRLEHMRRVTGQHLRKQKLTREKVLAVMIRLLESAFFRPGSEIYTKENNSYGLTTLRSKHLSIEGDEMVFSYKGKAGKEQERQIVDARLTKIVKELDELPGYQIFKYLDTDGQIVKVNSEDLNAYIHEHMGKEFSAKDFRTWAGTMVAAIALDELGAVEEDDQKKLDENIRVAVIRVSEKLGNTPAIARSSYIDPRIIEEYIDGKTLKYFEKEISRLIKDNGNLSPEELGVLHMLKNRIIVS